MKQIRSITLIILLVLNIAYGFCQSDTTRSYRKARVITHSTTASLYVGSFLLLNEVWYKQYPRSSFHFFDDSKEWMQVDKFGHAQTAYFLTSSILYPTYKKLGYTNKQAILGAAALSWTYQATIELLDGYSTNWGASWSDLGANTFGVALATSQQLLWNEQRILFKYSTSTVDYNTTDTTILRRVDNHYGTSLVERLFKDYNGTTFWFSGNISSFLNPKSNFPKWLNIAAGYGAQGMLGGFENKWMKDDLYFDYTHIDRYRQYYLSLDIDFTKIPIKGKAWKHIAPLLNIFKMPSPTLEFNKNGLNGHWIYF